MNVNCTQYLAAEMFSSSGDLAKATYGFSSTNETCKTNLRKVIASNYCCSPVILWKKIGQPATNCNRMFFNGFRLCNVSLLTYQKS